MSDLILPSWVDQTPGLRQALTREGQRLRDYASGKYEALRIPRDFTATLKKPKRRPRN